MIVLITGANGFVGSALCREAIRRGHHAVAVVRPGSGTALVPDQAFLTRGSFADPADAARLLDENQPEAVFHAAATVSTGRPDLETSWRINVEGTRTLAQAALDSGRLRRWVQISSMSAHPANKSIYGATKLASERELQQLGLSATILRPSLIYGPQRRGIFHKLVTLVHRLPVVPLIGSGREPVRPVHVEDVAWAAFEALEKEGAAGGIYPLGGPEDWRLGDMMRAIAHQLGKLGLLLPIPMPVCRLLAVGGEIVSPNPPLTTDNLEGIDKALPVDTGPAERDLDFQPRSFGEGFRQCLAEGLLNK